MTRLLYDVCMDHLRLLRAEQECADRRHRILGQKVLALFVKDALDGVCLAQCTLDVLRVGPHRHAVRFHASSGGSAVSVHTFQVFDGELEPAWDDVSWNAENAKQEAARCSTFIDAVIFVLGITLEDDDATAT